MREQPAAHGVRGSGLPEYRRVLVAAPRHHDDHGRHLHARLRFCNVAHRPAGCAGSDEPARVADAVAKLGLKHVVITSVDRDDLPDGGAGALRRRHPRHPRRRPGHHHRGADARFPAQAGRDRDGGRGARPDVFNHNLETVPRLYPTIRPGRALLPVAAAARQGQAARPHAVHQVRPDGRPGRERGRDHAGDGRSAHRRRRFPHHRPVPAADGEACGGGRVRHAGGVRRLCRASPAPRGSCWCRRRR